MSITFLRAALFAVALAVGAAGPSAAADTASFDAAQTEAIGRIVRAYLVEHPEVLVEAMNVLEQRQAAVQKAEARKVIEKLRPQIERDADAPVLGNANGDVTVVEFFDYRCGYCKLVYQAMMKVIADDGKVRLVLKDLPVLDPDSEVAARAGLAAGRQGKYAEFLAAGLAHKGAFTEDAILAIGQKIGLDIAKLRKDMADPAIDRLLDRNRDLARALEIRGTPAFVIGDEVIPGAVNERALKERIAKARAAKKG